MTEKELYQLLLQCMPPQLDAVTSMLQLNEAFLPGSGESPATRASAILKLVKPRGARGLDELERTLHEVLDLEPAPKRTRGRDTGRIRPGGASPLEPAPAARLRTIRIFLASSEELREDRDEFELYFRQRNDRFRKERLYLEIQRWENFLDAMSETRLQDEYNRAVRDCDIFVSLFFTKTGKFTEEEFDTAHRQFLRSGRPLIYTFFKNADIKTGSARPADLKSLWAFQEKLSALGHFYTRYDNVEHLKRQFRDQLDRFLEGA
jgi:hypothetical protein